MPSATRASLNGCAAGCSSGSSRSSTPLGVVGADDGEPPVLAEGDVGLLHEPEHVGVEVQRLGLVVDEHARAGDPHGPVLSWGWRHRSRSGSQGGGVEVVEGVAALAPPVDEPGRLEDVEVLGDRLSARGQAVGAHHAGAQLEQRLAVPLGEGVQQGPPGGVGQRLEQGVRVIHVPTIGKHSLACQGGASTDGPAPGRFGTLRRRGNGRTPRRASARRSRPATAARPGRAGPGRRPPRRGRSAAATRRGAAGRASTRSRRG